MNTANADRFSLSEKFKLFEVSDQEAYLLRVERWQRYWDTADLSVRERWENLQDYLGAISGAEVRIESGQLRTGVVFGESFPLEDLKPEIMRRLNEGKRRSELLEIPSPRIARLQSRNVIFSRLSEKEDEDGWHAAMILVGRKTAPLARGTPGFVTLDIPLLEQFADAVSVEGKRVSGDQQIGSDSALTALRKRFTKALGPNVEIAQGPQETIISGIDLSIDYGKYKHKAILEICVKILMGSQIASRAFFTSGKPYKIPFASVEEFEIAMDGRMVFRTKVTLKQFQDGKTTVVLPTGWWWLRTPPSPVIDQNRAVSIALKEERSRQPAIDDLRQDFVSEAGLWPESPAGRLAYILELRSGKGRGATYVIDAVSGAIIRREQRIRS